MRQAEPTWKRYLTEYNEGLGLVYERFVLNDFLQALRQESNIQTVLEAPLFGMAGVSGINSVALAQAGCEVTLVDDNPVLKRLKSGEQVSDAEIRELADLLRRQDPYITEELLRKVYDHKAARFIQFLRHILGLQKLASWPETVTAAFDRFIAEHNTFGQLQIQFIQTLRTFILQTGRVEKKDLIEAPFTQIHPRGIRGVFNPGEITEILEFSEELLA